MTMKTPIEKITPPPLAPHIVARPRIATVLDEVMRRRLTALSAGAGFGKTTALVMWALDHHCAWYTAAADDGDPLPLARGLVASLSLRAPALSGALGPALDGARGPDANSDDIADALASALSAALQPRLTSDVALVIDDLHEIPSSSAGMRLIAGLCHMAPQRLHLLLASRADLPFPVARLRLHGQMLALTAESLRFDVDEAADLLVSVGGAERRGDAPAVIGVTSGWPAAVRLVAERLATTSQQEQLLAALRSGGGTAELVDHLLVAEAAPPDVRSVLVIGAALATFNADLLARLGVPDPTRLLESMRRRGLHVTSAPIEGWYTLTPMSREYARDRLVTAAELERIHIDAVHWFWENGDVANALTYACRTTDGETTAKLLERHGSELLAAGHGSLVAEALASLDPEVRRPGIDLVEGEAREVRGDWDGAAAYLSRLVPAAGPAPAAVAWRLGLIHHMRGELDRAMALYRRGRDDADGSSSDRAHAAAWGAAAAWLTGDTDTCRCMVADAEALAAPDDNRARAAIHTARAMLAALDGDRRSNDMQYVRALEYAERAGDLLQVIRIRSNRGSHFLEEGYYAEALSELDTAIELAELAGYAAMHALALGNRGLGNRMTGRFDEAIRDLNAALGIQQRIGSRMAGYALTNLGAVYADQGNTTWARAAYEEAVRLAEPSGDLQGLVPALSGLASVVAEDDPDQADRLLTRALAGGASLGHTAALLAAGWIALGRDDRASVRDYAAQASSFARARRDRAGIAEALELSAAAAENEDEACRRLHEAESMWEALDCPLPLARTRLALARRDMSRMPSATGQIAARLAEVEQACRLIGARSLAAEAAQLRSSMSTAAPVPEVSVRTLGGFRVVRRGAVVPHQAWQSRKARDLLKILVAHRGAPVARGRLCEYLWPQADPDRTSNRLSVAISTLRLVVDPTHECPSDQYIASAEGAVWLRLDRVSVDVESFLRRAESALASGQVAELTAAEAEYAGEFCAEDRYTDWADALRVEAQSAYVAVERALAEHHAAVADHETAVRHLHRLLACEPYDERAYLLAIRELDSAGRHGDARRTYRSYVEHMAELELEPAPYPDSGSGRARSLDRGDRLGRGPAGGR
jgi:ATP/maltotriose-dependent transcriptional regulator MalT/DNA-binding SARP family transcriptional activator